MELRDVILIMLYIAVLAVLCIINAKISAKTLEKDKPKNNKTGGNKNVGG